MGYQTQSNAYIAYKVQDALGTPASGAGARVLRTAGGQGGRLTKAAIESNEVRRDGMSSRGRHGSQKTQGTYSCELSMGLCDDILQAVMRGTFSAADLTLTKDSAELTSVTTDVHAIVAAAGSWITAGLRVGDVIRAAGLTDAANNGRNLRVVGLTATIITVAETLIANAVANADFTITRPGRVLVNPAAGSLIKRYFTLEEHEIDIDGSEIFSDAMWGSLRFAMAPNGNITIEPGWVGTGRFEAKTGADAPHFAGPTEPVGDPLAALDAQLRFGSSDVVDLTSFDLTIDITPNAPDVVAAKHSPDVFAGNMQVSMNITALRSDLLRVADFIGETPMSLHLLAVENAAAPQAFFSLFVPNFTLGSVDKSALAKAGGPRTQTMAVPAALVGKDNTGGAFDPTMIKFQLSNAA